LPAKKITSIADALESLDPASLELTVSEMHEIRGEAEILAFTVFRGEVQQLPI